MARPQVWTPGAAVRQGRDSDGEIRPTEGGDGRPAGAAACSDGGGHELFSRG